MLYYKHMKHVRYIILIAALLVTLTGCIGSSSNSWFSGLFGSDAGTDFALDNDAVFDLFQDDFGSGTEYDDLFKDGGNGDLNVSETNTSADGQISYGSDVSQTIDPEYNRIGAMTPAELHGQEAIEIPVLALGNNLFPFPNKQFGDMYPADLCDHTHYHGDSGYTLDRNIIPEPESPCGFDDATKIINVTGDEMIDWFHNRPRNF